MSLERIALAALAATVALNLTACGVGEARISSPENQVAVTPLPVEVSSPVTADIFATYHTTTTITADAEAAVLARVGGEVVEILVEEGAQVSKGQILARLDGDRLRLMMLQAKANLEKVTKEFERFIRLHDKGLVSASAFEGLKFDMDALEAVYELQRLDYEYTIIRAPISGVVSARQIKIGQHVDVNDATFRITDTSSLVAYLRIPQTELAKFEAGHQADVRVDAMPEVSFDAQLVRISPTIDKRNGTFRATAQIDNEDGLLVPGMFGRFDIAYEEHVDALLIPTAALLKEDNQTVVYVVEDGAAVRRIIETGIRSGDSIEVLSGLTRHEQIVVTGQGSLRDGSRVFASIETEGLVTG
jgi:membrane fusion protein (multidrug efflux system)